MERRAAAYRADVGTRRAPVQRRTRPRVLIALAAAFCVASQGVTVVRVPDDTPSAGGRVAAFGVPVDDGADDADRVSATGQRAGGTRADGQVSDDDGVDAAYAPTAAQVRAAARRIELYVGQVSVLPGEDIPIHSSTSATSFDVGIYRFGYYGGVGKTRVWGAAGVAGVDHRSRRTISDGYTVRANWPVSLSVSTAGWATGVYGIYAKDSAGTTGRAIVVVRDALLDPTRDTFVFTALNYQAYNEWGGHNAYTYLGTPRATRISFDRPYWRDGGFQYWRRWDQRIVSWYDRHGVDLQYTTDYDLSRDPPPTAPRVLILPQHAEYVGIGMRDWMDEHVLERGDMSIASYGANSLYWQVRLTPSPSDGRPMDFFIYKSRDDPMYAEDPRQTTVKWRDPVLARPEGRLLGSQYRSVIADGYTRYPYTVTASTPASLLKGTGWVPGTRINGLLLQEGDSRWATDAVPILSANVPSSTGATVTMHTVILETPAGGRVFNAGTFAWADGFSPATVSLGVSVASFDRFNRNVLSWLRARPVPPVSP